MFTHYWERISGKIVRYAGNSANVILFYQDWQQKSDQVFTKCSEMTLSSIDFLATSSKSLFRDWLAKQ